MSEILRVLIIEDSALDAKVLVGLIQAGGYEVTSERVETAEQYTRALENEVWDIILADYNLPEFNGSEGLRLLQESGRDIPFIVISGGIGEDLAVQIMKSGAHDYLMKGNLARLVPAVEREVREARDRTRASAQQRALVACHALAQHPEQHTRCRGDEGVEHRERGNAVGFQFGTAVEAEPAHPQQARAEQRHGQRVRGHRLFGVTDTLAQDQAAD